MEIKVNTDKTRTLEDGRQVNYFTLVDDSGSEYRWHGGCPAGVDPAGYWNRSEMLEKVYCLIKRREYPDMPAELRTKGEIDKWIANGCKYKVQVGIDENGEPIYEERIAKKQEFKNSW